MAKKGLLTELPAVPVTKTGWPWRIETDPAIYKGYSDWPKITIVTPSFNQAEFIEETIRSVLLQNYPNLEYIIMDGGSTDGTKTVLEKYAPWLSYWQCEKDAGQGNAINLGFSLASGDYYAWINSDDYYLANVFATVVGQFLKSRPAFIYGYGYNKKGGELQLQKVLPFPDLFIKIPALLQPSTFWQAKIHQPIWEELHCALDFELWLRLVKGHKRHLVKAPLSVAHAHENAKTHDPAMQQKWHEDHLKIWSIDGHGTPHEWRWVNFLNRIRLKVYYIFKFI